VQPFECTITTMLRFVLYAWLLALPVLCAVIEQQQQHPLKPSHNSNLDIESHDAKNITYQYVECTRVSQPPTDSFQ